MRKKNLEQKEKKNFRSYDWRKHLVTSYILFNGDPGLTENGANMILHVLCNIDPINNLYLFKNVSVK